MIGAHVTAGGAVRLQATNPVDEAKLRSLLYLKPAANGRWVTWWTYISDLRRDLGKRLQFTSGSADSLRGVLERVKRQRHGNVEAVKALFRPDRQPYPYQVEGILAGLNCERLLIADDVGLGKTIQSTGIMLAAFRRGLARRAVVVCPPGLRKQWWEEIHEFGAEEAVPQGIVVVSGGPRERRALYAKRWRVLILNPEILLRDIKPLSVACRDVDLSILDEASVIRNEEAKVAKAVKTVFCRTRFKIALTATPIENGLMDLRSIFEWIDPRVFISRDYFNRRYVEWRHRRFTVKNKQGRNCRILKVEPKRYVNLGEVREKIRPCYIRRRAEEVGQQLPRLIVKWDVVELGARQREVYESCKADAVQRVPGLRGQALYAPLVSLREACNSTALVVQGDARPAQVKVDRLRELLSTELLGQNVIVFTEYERFVRILARELREFQPVCYTGKMDGRERQAHLNAFRAGSRKVLIATEAGSRGHNLQVANIVVNADVPFNPAELKQRVGRARRLKSKHEVVRVINMVAAGTVEETLIMRAIYSKMKLAESIFGSDELTDADPLSKLKGVDLRRLM